MRFLSLYKPVRDASGPPSEEHIAAMTTLCEEMFKSGALLSTEGCLPSSHGAKVQIAGDSFTVTDGPFTETKELVAGLAVVQANSKEEAVEQVKTFLKVMGEGECVLFQLYDQSECPGQAIVVDAVEAR